MRQNARNFIEMLSAEKFKYEYAAGNAKIYYI